MNNPTLEQWNFVIETLEIAQDYLPNDIEMVNTEVDHTCGTPMCFAGNYAVARRVPSNDYDDGAKQLALDLGFVDCDELVDWAAANEYEWGGENGSLMFENEAAFIPDDAQYHTIYLQDIIDWLKGVRDRCHPNQ